RASRAILPWPSDSSLFQKSRSLSRATHKCEGMRLDGEDGRSGGLPRFERAMGFAGVLEREALLKLNLDLAGCDNVKELSGGLLQLLVLHDVIVERRPGEEERALLRQQSGRQWIDRPGGIAEAHHNPAAMEAIQ